MGSFQTKITDFCVYQSRTYDFYRMALIVCIVLAVYSNTLNSPFIFDDSANVVNSPLIMDLSLAGLKGAFYSRRAIGIITFQLNYYLSGWNVLGYHVTNIFIHICSALAVYRLLQLLMKTEYIVTPAAPFFCSTTVCRSSCSDPGSNLHCPAVCFTGGSFLLHRNHFVFECTGRAV